MSMATQKEFSGTIGVVLQSAPIKLPELLDAGIFLTKLQYLSEDEMPAFDVQRSTTKERRLSLSMPFRVK